MAIAAAYDLEIKQYDAVNAFINADMDQLVYCYLPEGFSKPGYFMKLRKALYGLRTSPRLWHKELSATLRKLGLKQVPGIECLYQGNGLIIFFYVDDIMVMYHRSNQSQLAKFERGLMNKYDITCLGDARWFLGIRIERDKDQAKI